MKIKLLDTFSWVWWFHLALQQSIWKENIDCIWYSEIDKFAKQVYNKRFPNAKDLWSITDIDINKLEDFDLLTWWFPCQDVSVAWKQNLEWWRTVLVEYLLQILEKKKPKYFVFENVKWFMSKKFDKFRESIFKRIIEAGYDFVTPILNTKDFWLPQNRERVFIIWEYIWDNSDNYLKYEHVRKQELTTFLEDLLEKEVDEKYYLSNEKYEKLKVFESNARLYKKICCTLNTMQWWHRQLKIWTHSLYPRTWWKKPWGTWHLFKKDWSSYCLDTWNMQWIEDTELWYIRKLTPVEVARLQWFSDNWSTDFVSNSQAYKQMWNAISVPVVKAIFDNLF
jgi:DNA (cytosine-5)-methyltransferase 1